MKAVCEALGLARSHIHTLKHRSASWSDGRKARVLDDSELVVEVCQQLAELPSYGYRRACALVNRQRLATGRARVNAKRVYRVMAAHKLLLPRAPRRRHSSRPHSGKVGWCASIRVIARVASRRNVTGSLVVVSGGLLPVSGGCWHVGEGAWRWATRRVVHGHDLVR